MADYRKLEVWMAARKLAVKAYQFSEKLPSAEKFGLKSQIQRAAVSVVANIAEGAGRGSDKEFARFIRISIGSLNELDTLMLIAIDLNQTEVDAELALGIRDLSVRLRNFAEKLFPAA